jgi:two-component system cell cycle sensor histidine kinase/response regulator CckA
MSHPKSLIATPVIILIVADDPSVSQQARHALEQAGYVVFTAGNAEEAVQHLQRRSVDLLLLDDRVQGDEGLTLYETLNASGHTPPVILVTGFTDEMIVIRALRAGVRDVVPKSAEFCDYVPAAVQRVLHQVRTEGELAESDARLAAIIESAKDAIIITEPGYGITLFNRSAEQLFRCSAQDALGQRLTRFLPPEIGADPRGDTEGLVTHLIRTGSRGIRADGEEFPLEASASRVRVKGRQYHTVVVRDISERKQAEEALRQSEEQFRSFVETTRDWVWAIDQQRRLTYSNPALTSILGYQPEEVLGHDLLEYMHEQDRRQFQGESPDWCRDKSGWTGLVLRWRHKTGEYRFLEGNTVRIVGSDGEVLGLRGLDRDVTDRVIANEQLRAQAALLDQANDAILVQDMQGRLTFWNQGAERLYGWNRAEALGTRVDDLLFRCPPPPELNQGRQMVLEQGKWNGELAQVTREGKEIFVSSRWTLGRDEQGQPASMLVINTDITERKRLQSQFLHAQRMEGIGRLAGGVAHDFNNLLTLITGYSEMLLEDLPPEDPSHGVLREIKKAGDRAASLTRQLLAFSRKQVLSPQILDLNDLIRELGKMLRRLIGEDITLHTSLDPELGPIQADPGQLEQVILNLAVNARDAMPHGGKLFIETRNVGLVEPSGVEPAEGGSSPQVLLVVSDTGCGMGEAIASQVFEPFFTTKPLGEGTGLGLATVYGIVKQSGGHIELTSKRGQGTTFTISLPRIREKASAECHSVSEFKTPSGSETVLLAEDNEEVRALARLTLQSCGYTLLEASDGVEALELGHQHEGPIHLLLTDVVMPRMSGKRLAELLQEMRPELKALYLSGYNDEAVGRHGVLEAGSAFMQKPFTPTTLALKVREVLDHADCWAGIAGP